MAKKLETDIDALNMISGMSKRVKESRSKERQAPTFKKPSSDYYNLDMVVRDTVMGTKGHPIITEGIRTNYKEYIRTMAGIEGISITKYIHNLIDADMMQNEKKYKALKKKAKE